MNNHATSKVWMLRSSLRCLAYGLLALVPVLGLPFALRALWLSGQIRQAEKIHWNAARSHRLWGVVVAAGASVFWLLLGIYIAYQVTVNGVYRPEE